MTASTSEEAIRNLLGRYSKLWDGDQIDEWAELFTADATFTVPGWGQAIGREAIVDMVKPHLGDRPRGWHLIVNSIIEVSGEQASVDSLLVVVDFEQKVVLSVLRYEDRVLHTADQGWRFAERRLVSGRS